MLLKGAARLRFEGEEPVELRPGRLRQHPGPPAAPGRVDDAGRADGLAVAVHYVLGIMAETPNGYINAEALDGAAGAVPPRHRVPCCTLGTRASEGDQPQTAVAIRSNPRPSSARR